MREKLSVIQKCQYLTGCECFKILRSSLDQVDKQVTGKESDSKVKFCITLSFSLRYYSTESAYSHFYVYIFASLERKSKTLKNITFIRLQFLNKRCHFTALEPLSSLTGILSFIRPNLPDLNWIPCFQYC